MTLVIDISCKGASSGQRILLEDGEALCVGRANESLDLVADPRLSRKHFNLRYSNREIEITHLSRTNPTLVASEGSADFIEINGKQVESSGCRIIAGSHRFVVVVEAPDSIIAPTLSGEDNAEIWSDVDAESDDSPFFDSSEEPNEPPVVPDMPSAQATMPSQGGSPSKPPEPSKPVFSLDDATPQSPATPLDSSTQAPPTPPANAPDLSSTDKKMVFPLEDDFFD